MKDMYNNIKQQNAFNSQAITTNTTVNGEIIDTAGFNSLTFIVKAGTITDGDYAVSLMEGDNAALTDAALVADADLLGLEAGASFTADTDDNKTTRIGYRGNKRYVRLSITTTNVTTGGAISAVAILGNPQFAPTGSQYK
ncbi:hypothetical protein GH810_14435 [Acetobacterium paludosum]|uniref:Uncharacterized protein n=1 Tax=Acetobacterium paludosum TaxID=52693 RepID=A0A923HVX6_9FIRM|nr:hypothetical protein [Acetobacterium paludosum]MBC3889508.1 hypothetical protein [Acetobacterium paludosum]